MTGKNASGYNDLLSELQQIDYRPVQAEKPLANAKEVSRYKQILRQYFLFEEEIGGSESEKYYPLLTAPFLNGKNKDLPILYHEPAHDFVDLRIFLDNQFSAIFPEQNSEDLLKILLERMLYIWHGLDEKIVDFDMLVEMAIKSMQSMDDADDAFLDQCNILESHLDTADIICIRFSDLTAFQLLNLNLRKHRHRAQAFINRLKLAISGLENLLQLHEKGVNPEEHHFGFADDLISFSQVKNIEAPSISSDLSEARLNNIKQSLQTLTNTLSAYENQFNIVLVNKDLASTYDLKSVLGDASIEITEGASCAAARIRIEEATNNFVDAMAALKLAELEISQKYDAQMHAPYFEKFNRSYLSDEDLKWMHPIIVIEESQEIMRAPQDLLAIISKSHPVKIFSVNRLDRIHLNYKDIEQDMQLELASLAIIRRNTFIHQGGPDTPELLNQAFEQGLNGSVPALWNLLLPGDGSNTETNLVALKCAIESRFFPRLTYDLRSGEAFGQHFDVMSNPQAEKLFPVYPLEVELESGKDTKECALTIPDFLATLEEERHRLVVIPPAYADDDIIPLTTYLSDPSEVIATKLPFIWVVNEAYEMRKALVPLSWVQRCRSRIDYWRFLQELGGTNNYHVRHVLGEEKSDWDQRKKEEIDTLKSQLTDEFEHLRARDLELAIKNMLYALSDPDHAFDFAAMAEGESKAVEQPTENIHKEAEEEPAFEEATLKETSEIKSEAWVETDACTSCSDCTDALPGVFKYNDDKQAYVHNPTGGSYAEIVAAAEKCPARCIHPGLPHNPDEPNLEKLIKRAEKYNNS